MDFLKELFNGGAMTYDQLSAAVKSKGFSVVNAAGGAYVPKADVDGLNGQISTLTGQLNDANKKLEGYDPNWKTQAEASRKQLEQMQFDFFMVKAQYKREVLIAGEACTQIATTQKPTSDPWHPSLKAL